MCARVRRNGSCRSGRAFAPSGRRAAADRGQGDRASAAPGLLPECAAVTTAEAPAGSQWAFGPRLQAAVVTLAVRNRVSRRDTTELARELFGVELATGTVDAILQRAGEALAAPHTRLEQEIKRSRVVNIDETGWKTGGQRRMLWGALTRQTAVFRIAAGRHAAEAQTMLGERYDGIVCSDRYRGYDYLDPTRRRSAGRTCSATSPPTARECANNKTSETPALWSHTTCSRPGSASSRTVTAPRFRPRSLRSREAPDRARARIPQEHQDQVPPPVRQQPPQTLARPLDIQPHRPGRADQQPRRTRPPRRSHPPQTLTRHPIRTRRTNPRTTPLRLDHLPTPPTIALQLPDRGHHRPRPRRPHPRPQLTAKTG